MQKTMCSNALKQRHHADHTITVPTTPQAASCSSLCARWRLAIRSSSTAASRSSRCGQMASQARVQCRAWSASLPALCVLNDRRMDRVAQDVREMHDGAAPFPGLWYDTYSPMEAKKTSALADGLDAPSGFGQDGQDSLTDRHSQCEHAEYFDSAETGSVMKIRIPAVAFRFRIPRWRVREEDKDVQEMSDGISPAEKCHCKCQCVPPAQHYQPRFQGFCERVCAQPHVCQMLCVGVFGEECWPLQERHTVQAAV